MSGIIEQQMQREWEKWYKAQGFHRSLTVYADTKELENMAQALIGKGKNGQIAARNSASASLRVFNKWTGVEASKLKLKKSGKNWRKALTKAGSYKYRASARSDGAVVHATTFVNYKKAVLKISHLVEEGFRHFKVGKISGHWFRKNAFDKHYRQVQRVFIRNMEFSYRELLRTGKPVSIGRLAKRYSA